MPISLIAAFFGGLVSLLSPCSAMVLPAYFAASFHQKEKILAATVVFAAGLLLVLIPLGFGAFWLASLLVYDRRAISMVVGILLAVAGLLVLTGYHLPFPKLSIAPFPKQGSGWFISALSLGMVSGLGSSACIGPIFGAIITLAAAETNSVGVLLLLLAYTAGLTVPLFVFSYAVEKNAVSVRKILRGKVLKIGSQQIHSSNLLAGLLLLLISYIFLRYEGSLGRMPIFTQTGLLDWYFDVQDKLFTL